MRVSSILALLFVCLAGTYCLAQYSGSWTQGHTDLTSYCTASTNCAYLLNGGGACKAGSLTTGADDYMMCVGITNLLAYHFNTTTQVWDQITAMGGGLISLAVHDADDIYALYPTTWCTQNYPGYYGVGHWTGSAWSTMPGVCLATLVSGGDGFIGGIGINGSAYVYLNGVWTLLISSVNFVSITDAQTMCVIDSTGALQISDDGKTFYKPPQPPLNTRQSQILSGCSYLPYDGAHQAMYVTTKIRTTNAPSSLEVRMLTPTSTTAPWQTVYGVSPAYMAGPSYALTSFLDSGGHPYHYNVYPYYLALTMSGTGNASMCGVSCPPTAQHQGDVQITFPGGVGGAEVLGAALYNAPLSVIGWAASPQCDTFFGDPNAQACKITVNKGQVKCLISGAILITAPAPPTLPNHWWSEDYVQFEGKFLMQSSYGVVVDGVQGWVSSAKCYTPTSECRFPTLPYCSFGSLVFTEIHAPGDKISTDADANSQCAQGPFAVTSIYLPGHPDSCTVVAVDKHAKVPGDCF